MTFIIFFFIHEVLIIISFHKAGFEASKTDQIQTITY